MYKSKRHGPRPDHEDGNAELLSEVIQETIGIEKCVLAREREDNGSY